MDSAIQPLNNRGLEAKTKLSFLLKQKELNNTNIEQDDSVRRDTGVGSNTTEIKEEISYKKEDKKCSAR